MDKLFIVAIPWRRDGLTMKPLEVFSSHKEAVEYINGVHNWEILEIPITRETV